MKFFIALFALIAVASAAAPSGHEVPILRQDSDITPEGAFHYLYETGDGVLAQASGDANQVKGSYKFTSPEGTPVEINYIADENGFQPTGNAIPVPPEVPEGILRALEYIRTHPPKEETYGGRKH